MEKQEVVAFVPAPGPEFHRDVCSRKRTSEAGGKEELIVGPTSRLSGWGSYSAMTTYTCPECGGSFSANTGYV